MSENTQKPRIMIGRADVTEHVAAMFDALVGSLDWGSGFLDSEEIESILIVAELAGFDTTEVRPSYESLPGWWQKREQFPGERAIDTPAGRKTIADALAAWRAQIKAKANALAEGEAT